jgi:hypothetical protein
MKLHTRFGDSGGYEELEDVGEFVERCRDFGIKKVWWYNGGVCADGFEGLNYISLYWGPDFEPHNVSEWVVSETIDEINRLLDS